MNIFSAINKSSGSNYNKIQSTTEELIDRAFAPKNNKIDILFINPPSSISKRYGKEDMGEVGGDLIPLGIASLAAYIREKGYGVGVLDCPTLAKDMAKIFEVYWQLGGSGKVVPDTWPSSLSTNINADNPLR